MGQKQNKEKTGATGGTITREQLVEKWNQMRFQTGRIHVSENVMPGLRAQSIKYQIKDTIIYIYIYI